MTDRPADRSASIQSLLLTVLGPFALGYFISYLFRAVNAVVAPDLVRDAGLSAGELGFLTAAYLFGFAGFQLPLGVLLDRFGPRKVQTALLAVAALGSAVFAMAPGTIGLSFGRMLIGVGCAGGLMAGFKAVAIWVPDGRRALANAIIMAAGGLGILVATVPAEWASQTFGWRSMFAGMAVITLCVSALLWTAVPDRQGGAQGETLRTQLRALGRIYQDPGFWRIAPLVSSTCGVHIGIQTLWAGPWLRDVAGLDRDGVAYYLGAAAIGFLTGTLISGAVADWLARRGIGLLNTMLGFVLIYMTTMALITFQVGLPVLPLWFIFGMFGQAGILSYPWMATYFGTALAGRANAAMNFMVFGIAFTAQYTIGAIIDLWPATAGGGYSADAYVTAFAVFLAVQTMALGWYLVRSRGG